MRLCKSYLYNLEIIESTTVTALTYLIYKGIVLCGVSFSKEFCITHVMCVFYLFVSMYFIEL